ncbi:MAG TPA: chromosome partitioning protein ParB [Firmicutes bacterium]|nr:chromosome partitioning protein ParB [Bacillota bacterium]
MQLPKITRDEFFTMQEERDLRSKKHVENLKISDIADFPNHPFKVIVDDEMREMSKSIEEYGVLVPVLVRPKQDGKYEMISGHRRKKASELANKDSIPCIIRELTDDEATIIMVDSNMQREHILPSEKAFAYKLKLEALNSQGKRNDLTLSPMDTKLDSAEKLGKEFDDSRATVFRYIRLTELIPKILDMVDSERIAFRPAVEISYLTKDEQNMLLDCMEYSDCTPSLSQAIQLKELSRKKELNQDTMDSLMEQEKPNQKEKYKFNADRLRNLLPRNLDDKGREDYVVKAVEFYNNHQRKKQMER